MMFPQIDSKTDLACVVHDQWEKSNNFVSVTLGCIFSNFIFMEKGI